MINQKQGRKERKARRQKISILSISVFIMAEADGAFISVTKTTEANWNDLKDEIVAGIKAAL